MRISAEDAAIYPGLPESVTGMVELAAGGGQNLLQIGTADLKSVAVVAAPEGQSREVSPSVGRVSGRK